MAVRLGDAIRPALSLFDATFFVCLLGAGYLNGQQLPYYVISVLAPFLICLWHIWSFDQDDPEDSFKTFTVRRADTAMHAIILILLGKSLWCGDGLCWNSHGSLLQTRIPLCLSLCFHSMLSSCGASNI